MSGNHGEEYGMTTEEASNLVTLYHPWRLKNPHFLDILSHLCCVGKVNKFLLIARNKSSNKQFFTLSIQKLQTLYFAWPNVFFLIKNLFKNISEVTFFSARHTVIKSSHPTNPISHLQSCRGPGVSTSNRTAGTDWSRNRYQAQRPENSLQDMGYSKRYQAQRPENSLRNMG